MCHYMKRATIMYSFYHLKDTSDLNCVYSGMNCLSIFWFQCQIRNQLDLKTIELLYTK